MVYSQEVNCTLITPTEHTGWGWGWGRRLTVTSHRVRAVFQDCLRGYFWWPVKPALMLQFKGPAEAVKDSLDATAYFRLFSGHV